eukprot:TRINITY_DN5215_c0_g2_i3.p1 TRINITY_DN5215_c0_g2~~TRINITY_DN5215_c0_g2_i3.p1  ORF type:complete len:956 (+),score=195.23 TRINITY_DN5215_c0_g2_i3:91-2958(+)
MCGILALLLADPDSHANQLLFDGLTILQHRGQDAAGMATCEQGRVHTRKANGLVKEVFEQTHMQELIGNMGVGHCRYPTAGTSSNEEAQPFFTSYPFGLACAHNGTLTNVAELQDLCRASNRHFNTNSDSELLLNLLAEELSTVVPRKAAVKAEHVFEAVGRVHRVARGGYACALMITGIGIVVFRDVYGIRPLVIGKRRSPTKEGCLDYVAASESVVMDTLCFELERDVAPGETVFFDLRDGSKQSRQCYYPAQEQPQLQPCIFEYVYFARPDSRMNGVSVYESRVKMGEMLAKTIKNELRSWKEIDVVIPIPDTSRTSAIETAFCLGKRYREGFQKNRYIARTFIMPGQNARKKTVRLKLNTIEDEFRGKNVLLVDDSIVRGTTSKEIIEMAREAGAKKVYFASAAPPVRYPNLYGIDLPTREQLIAADRSQDDVAALIGADFLIYQTLHDLVECVRSLSPNIFRFGFDASVFDGKYVTGDVSDVWDNRVHLAAQNDDLLRCKKPSFDALDIHSHEMNICAIEFEEQSPKVDFSLTVENGKEFDVDHEVEPESDSTPAHQEPKRYALRGVSAIKTDVRAATKSLDKGRYPKAFCKIVPDFDDPTRAIVMHADGVGTKSALAYIYWRRTGDLSVWKGIAKDAIVMNLDDLLCVGVTENILLSCKIGRNKTLIPKEVIESLVNGTQEFVQELGEQGIKVVMTGGDTSDVGDLVRTIIVDATVTAKIPESMIIDNSRIVDGDVIVGLASFGKATYETCYNSGIGSNGLTAARHDIFEKSLASEFPESFDPSLPHDMVYCGSTGLEDLIEVDKAERIAAGKLFLSPARTYAPIVRKIFESGVRSNIHGMVHCSSGGQTKVMHFVDSLHIVKDNMFPVPRVFELIQKTSETPWHDMYKIFNMGHRMEFYVSQEHAATIIDISRSFGVDAQVIGRVEKLQPGKRKASLTIRSKHGEFLY